MPYIPTTELTVGHTYQGATKVAIQEFDWQATNGRYLQTSLRGSVGKLNISAEIFLRS